MITGRFHYSLIVVICVQKIYKDDEDSFIDDSDGESEMSFNSKSSKSGGEADLAEEDDWRPKRVTRGAAKKQ